MGKCYQSIIADAPVDTVWNAIRDFHNMSWAAGVIETVEPVGDKGRHEVGAKRVLNGLFHETLVSLDDASRTMKYSIDDGPGPLASEVLVSYQGWAQLFPVTATNQTFVLWSSEYNAADEAAVGEVCDPVYHALLPTLAAHYAG
jgi:hypothetical protein